MNMFIVCQCYLLEIIGKMFDGVFMSRDCFFQCVEVNKCVFICFFVVEGIVGYIVFFVYNGDVGIVWFGVVYV